MSDQTLGLFDDEPAPTPEPEPASEPVVEPAPLSDEVAEPAPPEPDPLAALWDDDEAPAPTSPEPVVVAPEPEPEPEPIPEPVAVASEPEPEPKKRGRKPRAVSAPEPEPEPAVEAAVEPEPVAEVVEAAPEPAPEPPAVPRLVALVTGASRGIGRGIAIELGRQGWFVVVNYVSNADAAEECLARVREAGGDGWTVRADIGSADDRKRLVDEALQVAGRIDLLVNNAGVAPEVRTDLLDADEASFDRLLATNLKGPYFLTQQVARTMVERGAGGQIVTISSVSAYTASVNRGDYCLSKAGLSMLTALFAARLAPHGIGVYEVRPGVIATDMTAGVKERYDALIDAGAWPIRRWGTPEDVGRAVAAIARGDFPFSTGEVFNVDGGFHLRIL